MSNSNQNASNTSNEGKFDLSGVFDVQQDYITDLSGSYPNVNNAPLVAKQVLKLQDKIQDVTQSYDNANTSANNVLTEQNNMINIVTDEQKRLDEKKGYIDRLEPSSKCPIYQDYYGFYIYGICSYCVVTYFKTRI